MPIQIRPSWMSTSIRSPGPYGGSPDTNKRSRSASRSASDIPNSSAASATRVPWLRTRYGTTVNKRRRRSEARSGAFLLVPRPERVLAAFSGTKDRLDSPEDLGPGLLRLQDLGVGSERQHPRDELLPMGPRHPDLDPSVLAGTERLGLAYAPHRPPGDLGREGNRRGDGGLFDVEWAAPDVVRRAEALGRRRALTFEHEGARDPRETERPDLGAVRV